MATSYTNPSGSGDRSTTVLVTHVGGSTVAYWLVNGNTTTNNFRLTTTTGCNITFWFPSRKVIDEAKLYQSATNAHGDWKWQGSNDATTWTDIGGTFTLGGVTTQTLTTLAGNTTAYIFYRLLQVSGVTSSTPYLREFEFKVDEGGTTSYLNPLGSGNRTSTITMTANGVTWGGPSTAVINGTLAWETYWTPGTNTGAWLAFDLGNAYVMQQARFYFMPTAAQGDWKFQGSPDASTWTDLSGTVTLGLGPAIANELVTRIGGFESNTTAYRHYRLLGVSGSHNDSVYEVEIEFMVAASPTVAASDVTGTTIGSTAALAPGTVLGGDNAVAGAPLASTAQLFGATVLIHTDKPHLTVEWRNLGHVKMMWTHSGVNIFGWYMHMWETADPTNHIVSYQSYNTALREYIAPEFTSFEELEDDTAYSLTVTALSVSGHVESRTAVVATGHQVSHTFFDGEDFIWPMHDSIALNLGDVFPAVAGEDWLFQPSMDFTHISDYQLPSDPSFLPLNCIPVDYTAGIRYGTFTGAALPSPDSYTYSGPTFWVRPDGYTPPWTVAPTVPIEGTQVGSGPNASAINAYYTVDPTGSEGEPGFNPPTVGYGGESDPHTGARWTRDLILSYKWGWGWYAWSFYVSVADQTAVYLNPTPPPEIFVRPEREVVTEGHVGMFKAYVTYAFLPSYSDEPPEIGGAYLPSGTVYPGGEIDVDEPVLLACPISAGNFPIDDA